LEAEVNLLLLNPVSQPPDLAEFLSAIKRLVSAARREQNPIVFI
jgi:hypothetical protein